MVNPCIFLNKYLFAPRANAIPQAAYVLQWMGEMSIACVLPRRLLAGIFFVAKKQYFCYHTHMG